MRSLFDVNLLLALLQPDHVHFDRSQEWWGANQHHGWASCPLTQNGFVRIVSQQTYRKPLPAAEAVMRLAEQIGQTDHVFWSDDVSIRIGQFSIPVIFSDLIRSRTCTFLRLR